MDKLIFTRFETVYSTRKRALEKLDSISRYYAETVAIRYKEGNSIGTILALYLSEDKGDYVISFDSAREVKTHTVIKTGDEDDEVALRSINPMEKDIAIVKSASGSKAFYLFHDSKWESMTVPVQSSDSISLRIEDGILKADVDIIDCGCL